MHGACPKPPESTYQRAQIQARGQGHRGSPPPLQETQPRGPQLVSQLQVLPRQDVHLPLELVVGSGAPRGVAPERPTEGGHLLLQPLLWEERTAGLGLRGQPSAAPPTPPALVRGQSPGTEEEESEPRAVHPVPPGFSPHVTRCQGLGVGCPQRLVCEPLQEGSELRAWALGAVTPSALSAREGPTDGW